MAGQPRSRDLSDLLGVAAAAALVVLALLHLAPEAQKLTTQMLLALGLGVLVGALLFLLLRASKRGSAGSITLLIGLAVHSLVDGVVYASTFAVGEEIGVPSAWALMLHKLPAGMLAYMLALQAVSTRPAAAWLAFGVAGMTTPVGTMLSVPVVNHLAGSSLGFLVGASAGLLLFAGGSSLLLELRGPSPSKFAAAAIGAVLMGLLLHFSERFHEHHAAFVTAFAGFC